MGNRTGLALAVIACCALVARLAGAITFTRTAQTGTTTFAAGGVTGTVGYLGNAGGSGGTVYADYGAQVSGAACFGSDNQTRSNNLEVTCRWQVGDPVSKVIKAKSQLRDKSYHESLTDGHCVLGPPSWDGVATVTINVPVLGTSGGTSLASGWTANLGAGDQAGQNGEQSMQDYEWTIDPEDYDTQVKIVSAKVTASLNGTAVEQIVNDCIHKATARLLVSVVNP